MIGFLHTASPHVATFAGLVRDLAPGTTDRHVVDPGLLATARTHGPDAVRDGVLAALHRLAREGAGVVVCTCSTIGGTAESLAAEAGVPVLRVDRPMARRAVALATEAPGAVALVAALASTLGPTCELLDDEARRAAVPAPEVVPVLVDDAWPLFEAGHLAGYHRRLADAVRRAGTPARLQLKVDTGLNRGGAPRAEWQALFAAAADGERSGQWRVTGVWSHFACSDDPDHPANDAQEQAFREALALADAAGLRPEVRHLANSAATVLRPSARFDAVRCGIATYGLDPAPGHTRDLGLVPAMTVRARLAVVKRLAPGDGVSYGHTFVADRPMTLGLVPAGYGDGVPRHASGRAEVQVAGKRRPLLGRVCMDQVVVEVDDDAVPGDEVLLFGPGSQGEPTAQDWAEACGTINYEIVTRIGGRMRRTHLPLGATHDTAPGPGVGG